jgi:acyl-CoA reductase-like NAD-dependent aldehyde dehydrogenase
MVHAMVVDAVASGAIVLTGGEIPDGPGAYYPPTVVNDLRPEARLLTDEVFGPIAPICRVGSFGEALELIAPDRLGLSACVMTADRERSLQAIRQLDVGTVKIGAAFGGAPGGAADPRRGSGHGLGYGPELLDELTVIKVIHDASAAVPHR